jgi:methyl-accepting chemotaxis protein
MQLSRLKISTRLTFGFGLLVLLSLLSAGLSLSKLATVQSGLEVVVTDNNVRIRFNNEMSQAVHTVARVIRTLVILDDSSQITSEKEKIAQARERYDKNFAALQQLPAGEAGKALRAKIAELATQARALNNQVIEFAMANKDAEAKDLLLKQAGTVNNQWQDAIADNIRRQEAQNEKQFAEAEATYTTARNLLVGACVLSIALALACGWVISRSILRQLGAEPSEAAALAQGVASGDLSIHIQLQQGDSSSLMAQLKTMQESLVRLVTEVRQSSESVAAASAQISLGNQDLSSRTEQQASALEETAASMEQLGATVKQNADSARQANQLAVSASKVAMQGGDVVAEVVTTMQGINESSRRISDIIGVIDGIAFQTNILALNAAVEAARAGEQGRGFAVVASEVRSLAGRSADAAKEIKQLISTSVERVEQGTALVDKAGATMTEVVSSIRRVTDLVGEISAANNEQSSGVAQIGEAVTQMDNATQQNASLVEEMAAAASSMKGQADELVAAVSVFKLGQGQAQASHARTPLTAPVRLALSSRS